MRRILTCLPLLLLSACADPNGAIGRPGGFLHTITSPSPEQLEQQHIAECAEMGFKPKTDDFANCRLRLKQAHTAYISANRPAPSRTVHCSSIGHMSGTMTCR